MPLKPGDLTRAQLEPTVAWLASTEVVQIAAVELERLEVVDAGGLEKREMSGTYRLWCSAAIWLAHAISRSGAASMRTAATTPSSGPREGRTLITGLPV
jgi:hypothetical protein